MELTPKEEANELVGKMLGENNHYLNKNIEVDKLIAKQCALICVDEKIKTGIELNGEMFSGFIERLQDIKEEIQNL